MKKENYLGKSIKGFKFNEDICCYREEMNDCVGVEGVIVNYYDSTDTFQVDFGNILWSYPADLVIDKLSQKSLAQQLVDNVNQNGGEIFGLKAGDVLPANTINAWSKNEKNYYSNNTQKIVKEHGWFVGNRILEYFSVIEGEIFFKVAGSVHTHLRAEGYKKFAEEFQVPEKTYSIGQRFLGPDKEEYILAKADPKKAFLINLNSGNFWRSPVTVGSVSYITEKELQSIQGDGDFVLLKNEI